MDISSLIGSLHPLEIKVLLALREAQNRGPLKEQQLEQSAALEPSQLSMAVEWLLAKSLLSVASEKTTPIVSLTKIGAQYFEKYAPIERILSTVRKASQTGKRLTIQDIQSQEGLEPTEVSGAVGCLKKEGAIRIVAGGHVESTGAASPTTEALRELLKQLHGTPRDLQAFQEPMRRVIQQYAVKRGNTNEPFRIDDHVERAFVLTPDGQSAADTLVQQGVADEVSQLSPELLKDGSWRTKRLRK